MTNALHELQGIIQHVENNYDAELVAVNIHLSSDTPEDYAEVQFIVGKTDKDIDEVLAPLDREYDCGYGSQYLFGTVWFTKGIWATRYEYDGSENWNVHVYPDLPKFTES